MKTEELELQVLDHLEQLQKSWDMPSDLLERIHQGETDRMRTLIQIYRRLQDFYPGKIEDQMSWWNRPNAAFQGHVPIQVITEVPENLSWIAYVLETQWWLNRGEKD